MAKDSSYKSFKEYPGPVKRQDAFPLDLTSVYTSIADAQAYAKENPAAYVGQILTVCLKDETTSKYNLYYFGIMDTSGTLMQIMTLVDSQNLISQLGRVMTYKGSMYIALEDVLLSYNNEYIHASVNELNQAAMQVTNGAAPQAGDVYNVNMSDSLEPRILHVQKEEAIAVKWKDFSKTKPVYLDTCSTKVENGTTKYFVNLVVEPTFAEAFPPQVNRCLCLYSLYNNTTKDGAMKFCFYNFADWSSVRKDSTGATVDADAEGTDYPVISLELVAPPDNLDDFAKAVIDDPNLLNPAPTQYPKLCDVPKTGKDMYDFINPIVSGTARNCQSNLRFFTEIRNGDNIVYTGYMWDDLAGPIDTSIFATKAELAQTTGDASAIYRQR